MILGNGIGKEFVWVPVDGDASMDSFAYYLSQNNAFKAALIPRLDGTPRGVDGKGRWADIAANDTLIICGHGCARSTQVIGWKTANGIVVWRHTDLADSLNRHLTAAQKTIHIDFKLFMCWSADSILWKEPFAYRLACDLGRRGHGFTGRVIGYKGSVIMHGNGKSIFVHGSSRFTTLFGSATAHELDGGFNSVNLYVDKFNHYEFSKQQVPYNIP